MQAVADPLWDDVVEAANLLGSDLKAGGLSADIQVSNDPVAGDHSICFVAADGFIEEYPVTSFDERPRMIVELAKLLQDSAVFDGYDAPWPRCPLHPDATHSLGPAVRSAQAVWICPAEGRVIEPVGSLQS